MTIKINKGQNDTFPDRRIWRCQKALILRFIILA